MVFFVSFSVLGPECILSDGDVKITCMAVVHHHDSVGGEGKCFDSVSDQVI